MAKRAAKKKLATDWIEYLDPDAVDAAQEEVTVDAYGDYEHQTGIIRALGDELVFSFHAKVMGKTFQMTGRNGRTATISDWISSSNATARSIGWMRDQWN